LGPIGGSLTDSLQSLTMRGMRDVSTFPTADRAVLMHSHISCRSGWVSAALFNSLAPSQHFWDGLFCLPCMKVRQGARSLATSVQEVALSPFFALLHAFTAANPENNKTTAKTPTRLMADRYFCELNDDDTCESRTIQFIAAASMPFLPQLMSLSPSLSLSLAMQLS
jgi:hypothetical protein